jgi:hypothetical protein
MNIDKEKAQENINTLKLNVRNLEYVVKLLYLISFELLDKRIDSII